MTRCRICKVNEQDWSWQPFGPEEGFSFGQYVCQHPSLLFASLAVSGWGCDAGFFNGDRWSEAHLTSSPCLCQGRGFPASRLGSAAEPPIMIFDSLPDDKLPEGEQVDDTSRLPL